MSSHPLNQSPEDQFLHWHQEMEKEHKEQARHVKELQGHVEILQRENDQLWVQIEKKLQSWKRCMRQWSSRASNRSQ